VRLFLGIPTAGAPAAPFLESLATLRLPPEMSAFERCIVTGNFVPAQRDVLVERALEWGADFIAMCDDDMVLPADALSTLYGVLQSDAAVGLAGALYYSRDGLRPMVVEGWERGDVNRGWIPAFDRTPVSVTGVGFGCVVIRASAVAAFARPFFASQIYVERAAGRVRVCNEDYLFCARLGEAGYRVVLHPGVRCGHYDRSRGRAMPDAWETAEATRSARVLIQTGERFALVPLTQAPETTASQLQVPADVVYIETP
jgi:GT2 family glycosyltransferase